LHLLERPNRLRDLFGKALAGKIAFGEKLSSARRSFSTPAHATLGSSPYLRCGVLRLPFTDDERMLTVSAVHLELV